MTSTAYMDSAAYKRARDAFILRAGPFVAEIAKIKDRYAMAKVENEVVVIFFPPQVLRWITVLEECVADVRAKCFAEQGIDPPL